MARPRLFLHDSIGRGDRRANRPDDIVAVKQRLHRLGFYEPPPEGIGDDIDAEFETAIRAFQQDNGLQVDGRLEPGGETERNLVAIDDDEIENLLSGPTDIRLGGRVGARGPNDKEDVVAVKGALSDIGLYPFDRTAPTPPFVDTRMVEAIKEFQRENGLTEDGFLDPEGETIDALRRGKGRPGTRPGETEVAAAPLIPLGVAAVHAVRTILPHVGRALGGLASKEAIDAAKRKADRDRGAVKTEQIEPQGPQIFTTPADPLSPDNIETLPAEEPSGPEIFINPEETRKLPDRTETPAEPVNLPNKVIYESLEDDEFWRQAQILRRAGSPRIRQWNTVVGQRIVELGRLEGRNLEMISGGYEDGGNYRKEFRLKPQGELIMEGNPLKNGSWLDGAVRDTDTGEIFLFNTTDNYVDGRLKPREDHQVFKVLINNTEKHKFTTIPKPRKGTDLDEEVKLYDKQLRDIIRKTSRRK